VTPAAALLALALAGAAVRVPPRIEGRYRLDAHARVDASPGVDRAVDTEAIAVVSAPDRGGVVHVRLTSEGYACELAARADAAGALAFGAGQRCAVRLDRPEVRGAVDARLTSGRGRGDGQSLELDLRWELSGRVSLLVGGQRMEVMGRELDVPSAWAPEVPLRGTATTHAAGRRAPAGAAR
jgi:hypothetical protein